MSQLDSNGPQSTLGSNLRCFQFCISCRRISCRRISCPVLATITKSQAMGWEN